MIIRILRKRYSQIKVEERKKKKNITEMGIGRLYMYSQNKKHLVLRTCS